VLLCTASPTLPFQGYIVYTAAGDLPLLPFMLHPPARQRVI
jgi:hypothetical protein